MLPAALAVLAFAADLGGAHGVALAALLFAVPAALVLALDCYGDVVQTRSGGWRPLLDAAALLLLLLSAALRSPAVVGGVPRLAISAVVGALLVYAAAAVGSLVPASRRTGSRAREAASSAGDRLAA